MSQSFQLIVENSREQKGLEYAVLENSTAQAWFECLKQAARQSEIFEADRWYNIESSRYSSIKDLAEELTEVIAKLNQLEPSLINYQFDFENIQKSVNDLHIHFADSHLVKNRINEKTLMDWHRFNDLLHAFESIERSEKVERELGQKNASIILTFKNNFKKELQDSDYKRFTIAKSFGSVYINYCQVGRHLFELFNAQDEIAEDEHILPLQYMSADSYFWFGPSTGKQGFENKMKAIESWFIKNQERFAKLGFEWGDPHLGLGWIPVAELKELPASKESQIEFVKDLSPYKWVKEVLF